MAYVPNASDPTQPTGDKFVASAAPEFRAVKTLLDSTFSALAGFQAELDALQLAIGAGTNSVALAANLALGTGASLVGFQQVWAGSILRSLLVRGRECYAVTDATNVVGDGVTDCTAGINAAALAAHNAGKALYFPTPSSFYKTSSPIKALDQCNWFGENGATTIIRNTSGGTVITCDSTGSLGPYTLKQLRIGGIGGTGITATPTTFTGTIAGTALTVSPGTVVGGIQVGGTVNGAGVSAGTIIISGAGLAWVVSNAQAIGPITMTMSSQYVVQLDCEHVHFEGDLVIGIDANLIFARLVKCGFGIYTQVGYHAAGTHIRSLGNGTLNTNVNVIDQCLFYSCLGTYSCNIQNGGIWKFIIPDWEGNQRNLVTVNLAGLHIDGGYTERVMAASGEAFDFGIARTGVYITGGTYNGSTLVAGVSMFGCATVTRLSIKGADISTSAGGFSYVDTNTLAHFPTALHDVLTENRFSGNAADPLLIFDNIGTNTAKAFTPNANGFTIVNGTGGVTHAGRFSLCGRVCTWQITSTVTGTATIAAPGGGTTNYFDGFPAGLTPIRSTFSVTDDGAAVINGSGSSYINTRHYPPPFGARNTNVTFAGSFQF